MPENPQISSADQTDDQDHEKRLAISLVACLGFEGAIHTCQTNAWDEVLKWVIALRETGEGHPNRNKPH